MSGNEKKKFSKFKTEFVCPECGHIEEKSKIMIGLDFLMTIFVSFGIIFLGLLVLMGPTTIFNFTNSNLLTAYARFHSNEFREYALNITTYDGYDSFEYAEDLLANMPNVRYVPTNKFEIWLQDPEQTIKLGGDCKDDAILFSSLMLASGYFARADCDLDNRHCVSRVEYDGQREFLKEDIMEYIVVDLTINSITKYNYSIDHWKNPDKYISRRYFHK